MRYPHQKVMLSLYYISFILKLFFQLDSILLHSQSCGLNEYFYNININKGDLLGGL